MNRTVCSDNYSDPIMVFPKSQIIWNIQFSKPLYLLSLAICKPRKPKLEYYARIWHPSLPGLHFEGVLNLQFSGKHHNRLSTAKL